MYLREELIDGLLNGLLHRKLTDDILYYRVAKE